MTDFFDFLHYVPPYDLDEAGVYRLNQRYRLIVEPFASDLKNARVLDLACHDGRWSYALAAAGAREVTGVEARQELVDRFAGFPEINFKPNVKLLCGDIFDVMEKMVVDGMQFDVIAVYGIFYHIMDHMRLLKLCQKLEPKLIIIDGEFIEANNGMIQLVLENTENVLNATPISGNLSQTVVGIPSRQATEMMAEAIGYELAWLDKERILGRDRQGMHDYFRKARKVRSTCTLRTS
ncbi:methyltransferase domain-containing protein [Roseovarius sp. EL26]|uniref:methyltransferase domain-containing protein n=1 Tax=Roseovarius sp. EL26 TaxID=2126672 RepID=UPI000EA1E7CA|nr:methyltransferase domain-containing protein [Roseovarius sp. EL26]